MAMGRPRRASLAVRIGFEKQPQDLGLIYHAHLVSSILGELSIDLITDLPIGPTTVLTASNPGLLAEMEINK
jgi:hypothetical protein